MAFDATKPVASSSVASEEIRANFSAVASHHIGSTSPPDPFDGMIWIDNSSPTNVLLKVYLSTWITVLEQIETAAEVASQLKKYLHTQSVSQTGWSVAHNLGTTAVLVEAYDTAGNRITDVVKVLSANSVGLNFSTAQAGTAVVIG